MHQIIIPKTSSNDDRCILLEWLFETSEEVHEKAVIARLETSKASIDLESEVSGVLHRVVEAGEECDIGDVIGYVFASEEERRTFLAQQDHQKPAQASSLVVTNNARELMRENGIAETQLLSLGKRVIKKSDIQALIDTQPVSSNERRAPGITLRQAAVAKTVTSSHNTIPKAFVAMKVYCDEAMNVSRALTAKEDVIIGLTELLVKVVANLSSRYPLFFNGWVDEKRFIPVTDPNVGVTIDVGKGLCIPVIKAAASKSVGQIADIVMDFRIKALRDAFKEEDLLGGHITISLNTAKDVILAVPLILPTQSCMLSLCSVQQELFMDANHTVAIRSYVTIGLAYDHRLINGYDAVKFLEAIKSRLESPEGGTL